VPALPSADRRRVPPERAGQPVHIQLHLTLDQLRGLDSDGAAEAAWAARGPAAGPGADCDATIIPVVSGHVDPDVLDRLAAAGLHGTPAAWPGGQVCAADAGISGVAGQVSAARWRRADRAAGQVILRAAADLLSGPPGSRRSCAPGGLNGFVASVSLPLAAAHHERCLQDPVLNHPFSHLWPSPARRAAGQLLG
jgi:hypothetical protein